MGLSPSLETANVGCLIACLGAFALYSARRRALEATEARVRIAAASTKAELSLLSRPRSDRLLEWSGIGAGSIFIVAGCALVAKSALEFVAGSR